MIDPKTIQTYDKSAKELAKFFKGIGSRVEDVERGLKLADATAGAHVVEIGCGDGRDAQEIHKRVDWYEGFDPSIELLKLARSKVPGASFVLADALSYKYPDNLDVVFAFASLLHVNKTDLVKVFEKVSKSLKPGGILYLSVRERPDYEVENRNDEFGERVFYHYSPKVIKELSSGFFDSVYEAHMTIGRGDWLVMALSNNKN